ENLSHARWQLLYGSTKDFSRFATLEILIGRSWSRSRSGRPSGRGTHFAYRILHPPMSQMADARVTYGCLQIRFETRFRRECQAVAPESHEDIHHDVLRYVRRCHEPRGISAESRCELLEELLE